MSLANSITVVIGATSGIGRATVDALADAGAHVVAARCSLEKLAELRTRGQEVLAFPVDLTDAASVAGLFEQVDVVDHLVLTAADLSYGPLPEVDEADARRVFESKFWGAFHAVRAALPRMSSTGSIVFVSGLAAEKAGPGASIVAAVNGAIPAFARALAAELAPRRVNVVSPGIVDTPSWSGMSDADRAEFFRSTAATLPVGRIGRPEDVAAAVLFLLDNGYTTGETLHVNGGALVA